MVPRSRYDHEIDQTAANEFPPFAPFPGFQPNPFRASPAINTPTHRLNWTSLWTRRRSYHSFNPPSAEDWSSAADPQGRRRLARMNPPAVNNVSVGDVSLMAWPDNHWRYIFLSKRAAAESVRAGNWVGGYDTASIDTAERYSYASFRAYRDLSPSEWKGKVQINGTYMGTCTGLSKMPYIRDGRRSVGIGDFLMTLNNTHDLLDAADCAAVVGHGE